MVGENHPNAALEIMKVAINRRDSVTMKNCQRIRMVEISDVWSMRNSGRDKIALIACNGYHIYDIIASNRGIFGYQQYTQDTRII